MQDGASAGYAFIHMRLARFASHAKICCAERLQSQCSCHDYKPDVTREATCTSLNQVSILIFMFPSRLVGYHAVSVQDFTSSGDDAFRSHLQKFGIARGSSVGLRGFSHRIRAMMINLMGHGRLRGQLCSRIARYYQYPLASFRALKSTDYVTCHLHLVRMITARGSSAVLRGRMLAMTVYML